MPEKLYHNRPAEGREGLQIRYPLRPAGEQAMNQQQMGSMVPVYFIEEQGLLHRLTLRHCLYQLS